MDTQGVVSQTLKGSVNGWLSLVLLCMLSTTSEAQVGINLRYQAGQSDILDQYDISQTGGQASVEYHFRMKQKRVEFRPGLGYRMTFEGDKSGYFRAFDLDFGAAVYPFDFSGDCNCPTFSKQGTLVKKGFFIEVTPGLSYQRLSRVKSLPDDPDRLPISSNNLIWKIGAGVGLDLGLSDRYTLTPLVSATYLSADEWEGLQEDGSFGKLDDYIYLSAGFRLTYHKEDKFRRRR